MITVLLVIHVLIAISLIGVILIQRSEGGALGIGSSQGGGLVTSRGAANLLTRATAALAVAFFVMCVVLAILASANRAPRSVVAPSPAQEQQAPAVPRAPISQ